MQQRDLALHYENGSVPEDPSGTDHYGATYFTPYPKGTFIMGRLRNIFNYKGSGVDRINLPIDDTADFVFVKRTPKLSGGGFVWDIIFNAGVTALKALVLLLITLRFQKVRF